MKRGQTRELPAALSGLGRPLAAPEPGPRLLSPGLEGTDRPVAQMIRRAAVVCQASTPVREAAERMVAVGASAVLVDLGDGLGIVTDQDLPDDAAVLRDALELITSLRMRHQIDQLRAGERPTDHVDPNHLTGLTRRYLKEAFQEIGQVQPGLEVRMGLGLRLV